MFRWLACLIYGRDHVEINDGWAQPNQWSRQVASRADGIIRDVLEIHDTYWRDRDKQHRLEMELQNAEWILDYEKRLAKLQKKTAAQRSKAGQAGINTERLRRLEQHLAGLRRNLYLD